MYSSFSKKFWQIKPYDDYNVTDVPWHEAMVAGNGRLGVLESCAPIEDSLIYQNVEFVMPSEDPRHVPYEVTAQLDEARQSVINFDDTWNIHDRKRTNMYCYHPGHMIRLTLEGEPDISDYRRWTDYKTGTINTAFKSDGASISRSTYVSIKQNVIITKIIAEKSVDMSISIDDFEYMPKFGVQKNNIPAPERDMLYSRFVSDDIIGTVVHYPEYDGSELAKGGFAGVTRILTDGDMRVSSKTKDSRAYTCIDETAPVINISHAESITLVTYTDWTDDLGEYCEFRDRVNGKATFALVGIINDMLVYSDEHTIELLPAWSDKLGSGMVKGLRTRCGIMIDELKWDVDKKKVYVSLDWGKADEINIVCGKYEIEKIGHKVKA